MLDTIKYAERLQAAGMTQKVAKASASALAETLMENSVTKDDLENSLLKLEMKLTEKISLVKTELTEKISREVNSATTRSIAVISMVIVVSEFLFRFIK